MSDDDFLSLVGDDVTPIPIEKKVQLEKREDAKVDKARRRVAADEQMASADPLSSDPVDMVEPLAELSFMRSGVQHGVFKNLRLGKYKIEARLDLHRMTVDAARNAVYGFVQDCLANDVRSALVNHGKGEGREKPALLKSCVAHWLPQIDEVLAFHTAQKRHGSYGATYVLIRKSDAKKQNNKELHSKR